MSTSERPAVTQDRESAAHGYRVNLPFVSAEFRAPRVPRLSAPRVSMPRVPMPRVSIPNRRAIGESIGAARHRLPSPVRIAYYGGLAVMAALQLIEWPVAVAVGVGTALASRGMSGASSEKAAAEKMAAEKAAAEKAAAEKAAAEKAAAEKMAAEKMAEKAAAGKKAVAEKAAANKAAAGKSAPVSAPVQRGKRGTKRGTSADRTPGA